MIGRTFRNIMCCVLLIILSFSGCDYGLDYQSASKYCKDRAAFVATNIHKIESSKIVKEKFQTKVDELILNPLKTCYLASFICNIQCYNLNPSCIDSFYETNKYCDPAISNIPQSF